MEWLYVNSLLIHHFKQLIKVTTLTIFTIWNTLYSLLAVAILLCNTTSELLVPHICNIMPVTNLCPLPLFPMSFLSHDIYHFTLNFPETLYTNENTQHCFSEPGLFHLAQCSSGSSLSSYHWRVYSHHSQKRCICILFSLNGILIQFLIWKSKCM